MHINIKTKSDDSINMRIINGENIKLSFSSKKIILTEKDMDEIEQAFYELKKGFDSTFFHDLQRKKNSVYAAKIISTLSDERLMKLAEYNKQNPAYYKIFTLNVWTELFKRNGLPKAGYKLTFDQKAFLFAHGLK